MSTILVVNGEFAMRESYARAVEANGYLAIGARTAEEALDFLALNSDIHVVFAELNMPGRGGAWLVDQMGQRFPNVAIIILATADPQAAGSLSAHASVVSYLVEPVSADRVRAAVSEALAWQSLPVAATGEDRDPFKG